MTGALPMLLLADGRFPAGGHAHSNGLEPVVAMGLGAAEIPAFIAGRLHAVAGPEAHLVVAARRAAQSEDLQLLASLGAEAEARSAAPPIRLAARRLGSQLLRTARDVWSDSRLLDHYPDHGVASPRPVAFGVVCAVAGLGDEEAASAWLYDDAATVAAAAVRMLPLDAALTASWLKAQESLVCRLAGNAAESDYAIAELPAPCAPLIDLRSLTHANEEGRLFET
jgi:urease accessory protein